MNKCERGIDDFINNRSGSWNIKINGIKMFDVNEHCGDYNNFVKTFNEKFESKYTHKNQNNSVSFANGILKCVGMILKSTGEMLIASGDQLNDKHYVSIDKK